MGFCTPQQTQAFLKQVPVLEKLLVDDGILLFKYWLSVDQDEQEKRFLERLDDPLKQWKLSPVDVLSRAKYDEYTAAREAMLEATHTKHAPWTLVVFNSQKLGRLDLIRHFIANFPDESVKVIKPEWKPLPGKPKKERYRVPPKPLKPYKGNGYYPPADTGYQGFAIRGSAIRDNDFRRALTALDNVLQDDPITETALLPSAQCRHALGNYPESERLFQSLLANNTGEAFYHHSLALLYNDWQKPEMALYPGFGMPFR